MINFIKVLISIAVLLILAYPLIPGRGKALKLFPASGLRYDTPHNRKNFSFIILAVCEFVLACLLFFLISRATNFIVNIPILGQLFTDFTNQFSSQIDFIMFTVKIVVVNFILLYAFVIVKAFLKKAILDPAFGLTKKKKKKGKKKNAKKDEKNEENKDSESTENTDTESGESEDDGSEDPVKKRKKLRIPRFLHSLTESGEDEETDNGEDTDNGEEENKPRKYGKFESFVYGIFFEGESFEMARAWVVRVRTILQCFIVLVEILYVIFLALILVSAFFPLPMGLYNFLINTLRIGRWYIYPIISILFLQEICNVFRTPVTPFKPDEKKIEQLKKKEQRRLEARLRKLLGVLKKHFDADHSLRFYPEAVQKDIKEYEPKNHTYKSALKYIKQRMLSYSGRVVQSYMQCLDACFSDNNVYFASSFYSELGAYLIAYTHIRLLSGARMIYVVSDPEECATLRTFLGERLMQLSGTSPTHSWRIHTANERLDQADILIACPQDFRNNNMVAQCPDFFEEVCNAIFLDADKMISLDSYLCPVMATRLQKATENRVRFIFLTRDLYQGFAARTLPKFFCAKPVLFFSSAKENESVSYVLWNKESKSHRIYNENGQKTTCLEYMIADLACEHDIDGVRLVTDSPLDHAERKLLNDNGVEINKFYRDIVDVNYMVYSDENCNLASSIYACTRFRGQKKSVVHIISKPYLLREYFISKAATENFVNRSSFIQPRVPEHIDEHKLSLLRIFCDLADDRGISVSEFERRVREVINVSLECGTVIASAFCRKMLEGRKTEELTTAELASYLVAGLCDTDLGSDIDIDSAAEASLGHKAKEFYLIFDPANHDIYSLHREKFIVFNREREVFNRLFACNDRVDLCLNDTIIGQVDTFPIRTHLEYVAGQSILFNNSEYEIEHISEDGKTIYLRSENVKLSQCLDTIHLRRYDLKSLTPIPKRTGVLNNTKLTLEEIRVTECSASFSGETYGFYGLSSDKQTLDFYHKDGIDGNPHIYDPNVRSICDGRILKVELQARMECTDGMRLLLSAVFNEFIKTIFPKTYRCISIVPMLENPLPYDREKEPSSESERIQALYPYLCHPSDEFVEKNKNHITLLFINDCYEDVGAFQWFYDLSGRYMQEFLANIYSYLYWLKKRPSKNHYIYFGSETLPECFDLEGCCKLLEGYNRILAELKDRDIEIAGDDVTDDLIERCAFCHRELETGRYSLFDKHRFICADCFDVVDDLSRLDELHGDMRSYIINKYPKVALGPSKAELDRVYDLNADQVLSENYYRVDLTNRTIFTERDDPVENVRVSLLRGLIELWQSDSELINEYSTAQLYYEELIYLRSKGLDKSADWIYLALSGELRAMVDEISAFTGVSVAAVVKKDEPKDENPESTETVDPRPDDPELIDESDTNENGNESEDENDEDKKDTAPDAAGRTSFDFMRTKKTVSYDDDKDDDDDGFFGDDDQSGLYDPNKVPRFWKRYLRNQKADDGKDEDVSDAENETEDTEDIQDNTEPQDIGDTGDTGDTADTEDTTDSESTEDNKDTDLTDKKDKKKNKKDKKVKKDKKDKKKLFGKNLSAGEKILPHEKDEETNPKIRVYNEIVRHAYNYSTDNIDRSGINDTELEQIFYMVKGDYPELFWVNSYFYNPSNFRISYRCLDANGRLDTKQVDRKRRELKQAAKEFTKGITKRTDPYQALLTIYRRLIMYTDYDMIGLKSGAGKDLSEDDTLRSLHSALVEHKVVCAGYAIAMLYLMQSVGIVGGYTISESDSTGSCHAFNILKIGKYCYYLDATWGDPSSTETGDKNRDRVDYDYFCVPYNEFLRAHPSQTPMHQPRKAFYPNLETFNYSNHEYYRYNKAYLTSYNENEIVRIIADAAKRYNKKEMGEFAVGIRFASTTDAEVAQSKLLVNGNLSRLVARAKDTLKKKEQIALLKGRPCTLCSYAGVLYIRFN